MKCARVLLLLTFAAISASGLDLIAAAVSGSGSSGDSCAIGCKTDNPNVPVCGTDGVTYKNDCQLFVVSQCSKKVAIAYNGTCTSAGGAPSPQNGTQVSPSPSAPTTSDTASAAAVAVSAIVVAVVAAMA